MKNEENLPLIKQKKIDDLAMEVLRMVKNELYVSMRYFDVAFSMFSYQSDKSTFFLATDGETIAFHPRFVLEKYQYDPVLVNRAYLHLVFHALFRNMYEEVEDERVWNVSCDIAMEHLLDSMEYPCIRRLVSDSRKEWYTRFERKDKAMTAQSIYRKWTTNLKNGTWTEAMLIEAEDIFFVDDHKYWNTKQPSEDKKKQDKNRQDKNRQNKKRQEKKKQWEQVSQMMQSDLTTTSRSNGKRAGALVKNLKIENAERVDYLAFLRKFAVLKEQIKLDMDSHDPVYYHLGMQLYGNMPLIEPLEYKEENQIDEFAIVLDTSGSCSGSLLKNFVKKTCEILQSSVFAKEKANIHIIQCDDEVQQDTCITSKESLEQYLKEFVPYGHGNTDFRPAFAYVEKLRREKVFTSLRGLLYFTDGYGTYPVRRPDYDVAFLFLEESYTEEQVPPWAMKVVLREEEFEK